MMKWSTFAFLACLFFGGLSDALIAQAASGQFSQVSTTDTGTESTAQTRARIHTELGAGYYSRGQYKVALDELQQALNADSSDAQAYGILGLVYMALHEDQPAEKNFQRALDLSPNQPEIHNNYGWYLCSRHQYDEAIKQFNIAIANPLYTSPQSALTNAGLCSVQAGQIEQGQAYLEKSLNLNGDQPPAQTELAQLYYQEGRYTEASSLISTLIDKQADAKLLWLGLRIARKTGDHNAESSDDLLLRNQFPNAPETKLLLQGKYN
ncbi:MAG: type IV pilus biogenesis/stability protein PilW [Betaproteobacteria bacterium]|nr:type IV pilus biogenesis/stability protein PilW [Betaproteobacteria bacterium]